MRTLKKFCRRLYHWSPFCGTDQNCVAISFFCQCEHVGSWHQPDDLNMSCLRPAFDLGNCCETGLPRSSQIEYEHIKYVFTCETDSLSSSRHRGDCKATGLQELGKVNASVGSVSKVRIRIINAG